MALHRCTTCNKTFTALDFEHNHPCVDEADQLSMEELERRLIAKSEALEEIIRIHDDDWSDKYRDAGLASAMADIAREAQPTGEQP